MYVEDKCRVVTGGADGQVCLWCAEDGTVIIAWLIYDILLLFCAGYRFTFFTVFVRLFVIFCLIEVKVKVHTLDIAPLRSESPPQKGSGMARVLKGIHFTCTSTRSSAIGMSHTCLCLPSRSWYSFTDPGRMEG